MRSADGLTMSGTVGRGKGVVDLDAIISASGRLHPLPASVARLAVLVSDDRSALRDIVEVISFDQALTGAVLARANSAANAARAQIRTVHEAVVRLGTGTVLAMAMSSSVGAMMRSALPSYGLCEGDLWRHSVQASLAAELLRRDSPVNVGAEASTAALLHDVGKLVMARSTVPDLERAITQAMEHDGLSRLDAESLVLEINHAELSGLVVQSWKLPEPIVQAVHFHHHPEVIDTPLAHVVRLANDLSLELDELPMPEPSTWRSSMQALGLRISGWPVLVGTVRTRYSELAARYD
jgi:HD-like signal output (HDOD) protein